MASKIIVATAVLLLLILIPGQVAEDSKSKSDILSLFKIPTYFKSLGLFRNKNEETLRSQAKGIFDGSGGQADAPTSIDIPKDTESENVLMELVMFLISQELSDCDLRIFYGGQVTSSMPTVLAATFPNAKQVIQITSIEDFSSVLWTSAGCLGFVFLRVNPQVLLHFADTEVDSWDYMGRYIFVDLSLEDFESLASSAKGRKTENILGVIKSDNEGEYGIYINQLFSSPSALKITSWKDSKLTAHVELYPDKISNLQGISLKAVTFAWAPSVMYYKDEDGDLVFRYGLDVEIIRTLAQVVNFTVRFQEPPKDECWGEHLLNGSWTGMMGMIRRDEADMGAANLFVSVSRLGILDYTIPFDSERSCVILQVAPPLPSWQALAFPFHLWTWFSILVGLTLVGPILFFLVKVGDILGEEIANLRSLSLTFYYTFGMHLNEPQDRLPRRASTRVYILFLWLYCIIITIAYSTNLTAFLTVRKSPPQIETIQGLHDSGIVVIGVDNFYQGMLLSSPDPNLQNMGSTYEVYYDSNEIFRRVLSGKNVYIGNKSYLEFIILTKFTKRGISSLRVMKECFASHSIAVALQNHSPLKRRFDEVISWMLSGGLARRFFLNAIRLAASTKEYGVNEDQPEEGADEEGQPSGKESDDIVKPLRMDHLQGIFFVLSFGWVASIAVFFFEKFLSHY